MRRVTLATVCAALLATILIHASALPFEPGYPYTFYYGSLHTHTAFSDGGHPNDSTCASSTTHLATDAAPVDAYNIARGAGLDFLAVSDHNHQFNDACPGCSAAQIVQRYHDGLATAAASTIAGSFVALYGMEWGYISNPDAGFPNEGHVGVIESPKLFGWEPSACTIGSSCYYDVYTSPNAADYLTMYQTALNNPSPWGAFGHFEHPSDGTKSAAGQGVDFNTFAFNTAADDFIHTIPVISGPATDFSTLGADTGARYAGDPMNGTQYSVYTSTDMYNRALGAGFHVAPVADFDTHCSNYGLATRDRTVVLATSLTKASILDALHHRRVFATSRKRAQLIYTMAANATTYHMGAGSVRAEGGAIGTNGSITLHVNAFDPDGATVASIKIKEPVPNNTNGAANVIASSTTAPFDATFTPPAGHHTYYAYVTLSTGDELWSAPIWINQAGATVADTTPPSAPTNLTAVSTTKRQATLNWNAATDNVGVTGYTIWRAAAQGGPYSQVAAVTSLTYSDGGLRSGSTYFYYVTASDAAGNVSAATNTTSVTVK